MKFVKADFNHKVNEGSSWKVYICKSIETAHTVHNLMMTAGINTKDSYWHVSTSHTIGHDVRVPAFFHDSDYAVTCVEHNNGSWSKEQTYELYIVEE